LAEEAAAAKEPLFATPVAPRKSRLEIVRTRRHTPPRRQKIRGWIAESAVRSKADLKRVFALPAR
jgi:hypothetical protein